MIGNNCLLLLAISSTFLLCAKGESEATSPLKIVCYRQGLYYRNGKSNNENCTYVVVQVGRLDSKYGLVDQPYDMPYLSRFKTWYPDIKVILGLAPFDLTPSGLPKVIKSKAGRSRVIRDAVSTMKNIGYDGIDLMFEEKFVPEAAEIVSGIRKAIGRDGAILSGYFLRNVSRNDFHHVDLAEIANDLDFMTMECYEPTKTKPYTQLVAPLYSRHGTSVSGCIKNYLYMGAPRSKVLMAIQNYGVSHTLDDADRIEPGSPAKNSGWKQYPSNRVGLLYLEEATGRDWEHYRDGITNSPYSVNYLQWASYDDNITVAEKATFIKREGLGGVALTTYSGLDRTDKDLPFARYMATLLST